MFVIVFAFECFDGIVLLVLGLIGRMGGMGGLTTGINLVGVSFELKIR